MKSKHRLLCSYVLAIWLCCVIVILVPPPVVFGAGQIDMVAEVGFDGEIKHPDQVEWVPVRVTLTNNGPAVKGKVFVSLSENAMSGGRQWAGTAEREVELTQGASKDMTLILSSEVMHGKQEVVFSSGGKTVATAEINARQLAPDDVTIGILATSPDVGQFLSQAVGGDRQPHLYTLESEDVPDVGAALSGLDMIVINNYPAEMLNDNQVSAIQQWVSDGGTLFLGGGPSYQKLAAPIRDLSPVEVSGLTQMSAIESLQKQPETGAELKFNAPITVSTGTLKEKAKAYVQEGDTPIIAAMDWKQGEVFYAAYDLAAAPLKDWPGNEAVWGNILGGVQTLSGKYVGDITWPLLEAVNYIPSLKLPSVGAMMIAFVVYVMLVGPLLYFILRKFDRRGWAWGLIPACAVIVAIGVFAYGAGTRGGSTMMHNVNVVQMYPEQAADLTGAAAVFVPRGGTYELGLPEGFIGWPVNNDLPPVTGGDDHAVRTTITSGGTDITYTDVEFWSVRKAYVEGQVDVGHIASELTLSGGDVTGTVTNESKLDLSEAYLMARGNIVQLGTLKAGDTKQVDIQLGTGTAPSIRPGQVNVHQLVPNNSNTGRDGNDRRRKETLVQTLDQGGLNAARSGSDVQLIGWTEQPVYEGTVDSAQRQQYTLSLVMSPLTVNPEPDTELSWPSGSVIPKLSVISGSAEVAPDGLYFHRQNGGTVRLTYDLGFDQKLKLTSLQINPQRSSDKIEIFNWETSRWEEMDLSEDQASVNDYLSGNNEVSVRIAFEQAQAGQDPFYPYPTLEATGKVAP